MRRTLKVLMVTCLLAIGTVPVVVGQSEEPTSDPGVQLVEVPEAGFSASFPADWDISIPMARREAELPVAPDATEPAYETTLVWARAADGRWCDVDLYEGTALSLADHAVWLQERLERPYEWLQEPQEIDRVVEVGPLELPVGEAYRVHMDDGAQDRTWTMYLFGSGHEQYLLSCVAELGAVEDWLPIAESIELQPTTEKPAA